MMAEAVAIGTPVGPHATVPGVAAGVAVSSTTVARPNVSEALRRARLRQEASVALINSRIREKHAGANIDASIVDYNDPARSVAGGKVSVVGPNITDVFRQMLLGTERVPVVRIGTKNAGGEAALIAAGNVRVTATDPHSDEAKTTTADGAPLTLNHVMDNMGTYFPHKGLTDAHKLSLGPEEPCTLRVEAIFVFELEPELSEDDPGAVHLVTEIKSYHARPRRRRRHRRSPCTAATRTAAGCPRRRPFQSSTTGWSPSSTAVVVTLGLLR